MTMIFLIGHRGVGKTRILDDYQTKNIKAQCLDLDREVEHRHKVKIQDLFSQGLAQKFRQLELQTLQTIIDKHLADTAKKK